ncbi:cell division protein FtsX [Candidatus Endobugula sertula]|uniref:Cell division protein FtsX n=1 Tax=Candidatus Endobugula sertula TaxID=62101 RepID=A0A1D2QSS1_9GAMM|nr:cell division protein FtsX [Candidatus Endobugula sertula]
MYKLTPFFIGLRYIRARRRNQFISFISGFSLVGMVLGTMALILILSVMNGFDREIKQRILSAVPHGFIDQSPRLKNWQALSQEISSVPHIIASAPYIGGYGMLSSRTTIRSMQLQGILPEEEKQVSIVDRYMIKGTMDHLQPGEYGIVLGRLLAYFLRVDIGDKVLMTLPDVSITPAGLFPRVKRFKVVGIFEVGAQIDQSLAMIHLTDAQKLFRYGQSVQGLRLKMDDIYYAQVVVENLQQALGDAYQLTDWSHTQGSLFQAVQMEKRMVTLLLLIIIAVAALNILTGLLLMVADKRSDIAVLRTLGMTTRQVMGIFMTQGSVVGILGIVIGSLLGCLLALSISDLMTWIEQLLGLKVFDPNVYFISQIPSDLRQSDVLLICGAGITMSVLATLYPAYHATQVEPAEVLRYE